LTVALKIQENLNNTRSTTKAAPARIVAEYHGLTPMDLSSLKEKWMTLAERKSGDKKDVLCTVEIAGILQPHAEDNRKWPWA
jgi:hypothetical protein